MTTALLLAFLAQPECRVGPSQAWAILKAAAVAQARYKLPPGLLPAVVLAETGGRNVVARGRGRGRRGCDVGVAQVHVPECTPTRVQQLLQLDQNLTRAALVLTWSRARCQRYPRWSGCHGSLWGRFNPGSKTWWPTVRRIWRALRGDNREPQS